MTPIEGVEDISRRANHWYDPNVVDALREIHGLKPLEVLNRPEVPRRVTTLRVLRSNPAFSSLITAIGVSALGDPLTQVATLVTIYLFTGDPRLVALGFIVQALGTIVMSTVLGGITDRFPRRGLIVGLEVSRAATLLATPFLLGMSWWLIYPVLVLLACINAAVQPARQAAIPGLVPAGQVGKANAMVAATTMLAGAIGFGLAGAILALSPKSTNMLFIADAITFLLAAAIVVGIPNLGGGAMAASVSGALRRSWAIVAARPHLVVGTLAAFLIPISFPALLALAYHYGGGTYGGQVYSTLELVLSVGILAGSMAVSVFGAIGTMRTVGGGLFLTGVFSLAIAMTPSLGLGPQPMWIWIGVALFLASIGNPIYAVANQTAILEAADPSNRGSVMATRFGLVQTASIVGTAAGGLITQQYGPLAAYGVLGVGMLLLAMYAIAAGRSTTNPLHGAAYEEAAQRSAEAHSQTNPAHEEAVVLATGIRSQGKT
jgi:MFS family permease